MDDKKLLTTCDYFVPDDIIKEEVEEKGKHRTKITMKGILQKADTLNQNGRLYPKAILEREVRNYQKFITENRALGECDHPDSCVPAGSECFTKDGWKKIEDVKKGDVIATIDVKTNNIEYQRVLEKIDEDYEGKMYRFRNARSYDMTVTPNHRVLMWDRKDNPVFMHASEVFDSHKKGCSILSHSGLRRTGNWIGESPKTIDVAGHTIDTHLWAAFLGIYVSEGHCSGVYAEHRKKLSNVIITQNEGDTCDAIRELMMKLPWEFKERSSGERRKDFIINDEELHSCLFSLGGSRDKFIPEYAKAWSPELLNVLLEWLLLGDGRHRQDGSGGLIPEYCTTSPRLADDVFDLMLKVGQGATTHTYQPSDRPSPDFNETGRMIMSEDSAPMNIVCQHGSNGISLDKRFMKSEEFDYKGTIHCVVTKNQTWLLRQNNKTCWTGNSVISLKNVSHIIREARMEGLTVYGTVEILDTPSGKILQNLIDAGVKLGISSRGVGSTKRQSDYHVVQEDFQLICWDYVSEPSTPGAFMLPEGKTISRDELDKVFNKSDRINRIVNEILFNKNEDR